MFMHYSFIQNKLQTYFKDYTLKKSSIIILTNQTNIVCFKTFKVKKIKKIFVAFGSLVYENK